MGPPKNSNSDKPSSTPRMPRTPSSTPTSRTLSPSDTTSSPPGPMRSTSNSLVPRSQRTWSRCQPSSTPSPSQPPSTGEPREPSTQSRTKDNVDHAGLSPPPVPLKDTTKSKTVNSSPSPNKSSSIAIRPVLDAMEDGKLTV